MNHQEIEDFMSFQKDMMDKLLNNDHKSGWEGEDFSSLQERLKEETSELDDAVFALHRWRDHRLHYYYSGYDQYVEEAKSAVIKEAADVANFAMMIAALASRW